MAATCPNKKSVQWKQVMRRANGNEDVALEIWIEEGYAENPDLNVPEVNEEAEDLKKAEEVTPEDAADNLEALVDKTVLYLEKRKQALGRMKFKSQKEQRRQRNRLSKLSKNIRDAEGVKSITLFIDEAYKQSLQQKTRMKEFQSKIRSEDVERKDLIADLVVLND